MSKSGYTTARIEFLAATRDEDGQIIHQPGEVIVGEILMQRQDFLFLRTASGACMCVDASRTDLHCVDMECTVG